VVPEGNRGLALKEKAEAVGKTRHRGFGVLTRAEILSRLGQSPSKPHSLVVTPKPADEPDSDSIDLRLGSCFFLPRSHRAPCFIPGLTNTHHLYSEEYVPYGSYLVLPAHHTVLGSTLEYIKLPSDVSGQILTKSSWARTFITIETAPWIHPLYRGCLTLEIANVSNTPVVLYPGVKIAQLILLTTSRDTLKKTHDEMEGTYLGPVRPEPAQLARPSEALESLGIGANEMMYPFDDCFQHEEFLEKAAEHLRKRGYNVNKPT
jgi:dCTP deaminase